MNLSTIVFAVVTLILILIILYAIFNMYKKGKKKDFEEAFDRSGGGWDNGAVEAMNILERIPLQDRHADENFAMGFGLENNLLEGNRRRALRHPEIVRDIALNYRRALGNVRRGGDEVGNIAPNFIIRRTAGFAENFLDEIEDWDRHEMLIMDIRNFDLDNEIGLGDGAFNQILMNNNMHALVNEIAGLLGMANAAQTENINDRRRNAQRAADGVPVAAANIFLEKSKTHTSDPQNVHDSAVSKAMKESYDKIKEGAARSTPAAVKAEIMEFINKNKAENNNKAIRCLEKIYNNPALNTNLSGTDMDVLAAVWERSKDKKNEKNKTNIQEAIVSALADMNPSTQGITDDSMVCVTGRTGRLLESLTLLDHDKSMSKAATVEMYRNEIFDNAKKIIDTKIDSEKGVVGDYYRGNIKDEPTGAAEFKSSLVTDLNKMVDEYSDKLPAADLTKLKEECSAAIG